MTPSLMRQLWSLVDSSQSEWLQDLDDQHLENWLVSQMESRTQTLDAISMDDQALRHYIQNHLLLIRELADYSMSPVF
ncbi:hypothetical protein [Lyngbya confervoides]|uniref:Uncharacterized protein n=1 Tax=Lyngbya confervoides BDU141951 TaxID=1574623 RepID=A0ABD4T6R2_9CYAN|nr:hypothetical protein [Lyngbya confervoides]MCM1984146.1 hypothetical protein [Lyngbya confervoides BDU141951]